MKNSRQFIHVILTIVALGALAFTGCQTMNGAGKDIEHAGQKIQDNAK